MCHTLQPLPSRAAAYSRIECSPVSSSSTAVPTVTRMLLEEAPGTYLLRSYLAPASLVVEPLSVGLGEGLEAFPVTLQLPSPPDAMAGLARVYCDIMRDRIPQRVDGCAQKIVLRSRALWEERLVGALDACGGGRGGVLQHRLTFAPDLLPDGPGRLPGVPSEVDETALSKRQVEPSLGLSCEEIERAASGPMGQALSAVQVLPPPPPSSPPIRLLCLTYTISPQHGEQVRGLAETWAGWCDGYMAMSNLTDPLVPSLALTHDGPESYFNMWQKVRSLWREVAARGWLERYDFFFLGGDDVYLLPDNLKHLLLHRLAQRRPDDDQQAPPLQWYLGRRLQDPDSASHDDVYHSGGAGYVLSREAVRRLVDEGLQSSFCRPHDVALWEDVNVGHCMRFLGIEAADTMDEAGRETFHYQTPAFLLQHGRMAEVSPHSVSFHYVRSRREMHLMHALLYGDAGAQCGSSSGGVRQAVAVAEH